MDTVLLQRADPVVAASMPRHCPSAAASLSDPEFESGEATLGINLRHTCGDALHLAGSIGNSDVKCIDFVVIGPPGETAH